MKCSEQPRPFPAACTYPSPADCPQVAANDASQQAASQSIISIYLPIHLYISLSTCVRELVHLFLSLYASSFTSLFTSPYTSLELNERTMSWGPLLLRFLPWGHRQQMNCPFSLISQITGSKLNKRLSSLIN